MLISDYPYKVGWCKACDQGWLLIMKEIAAAKFWIICGECDNLYENPKAMIDGKYQQQPHKLGRCEYYHLKPEELIAIGWDSYVLHLDLDKIGNCDFPRY